MNTPPRARTSRADLIPPTPLHGARFDSPPPTSRKTKGKGKDKPSSSSSSSSSYSTATLSPPPSSPLGPDESAPLFEQTRKSRKRRASVFDEPVDKVLEVESEGWKELEKMFGKDFGRGPTAVPSGVGLPTPSKTPARKRKHLSIDSIAGSARRLFGSSSFIPTTSITKKNILGAMPSGSKKRMGRLDLTGEHEGEGASISIFTDNNARIPKYDPSPENPFITRKDSAKKRQVKKAVKTVDIDTLGDDGRRDDGMVYVFRGKKMFRKFTDMDEPDELPPGVVSQFPTLENTGDDDEEEEEEGEEGREGGEEEVRSKAKLELEGEFEEFDEEEFDEEEFDEEEDEEINAILNKRSSIRPRLLFPSKTPEFEESETDEEAETDVEDDFAAITAGIIEKGKEIDRNAISRLTPDSDDDFSSGSKKSRVRFEDDIFGNKGDIPKSTRKKPSLFDDKEPVKSVKGLLKDAKEGGSVRVKRTRQDAFAGSLSPPRMGKKAKDLS